MSRQIEMPSKNKEIFYDRDYWIKENLLYNQPHFRLEKLAYIINRLAGRRQCDLLDVGCGTATLEKLLSPTICYYGIDIALHDQRPNLVEMDFIENVLQFNHKSFDFIVASGVFEYMGRYEAEKLKDIRQILKPNGKMIATYTNMEHIKKPMYPTWNNVKKIHDFKDKLSDFFVVDAFFPVYHSIICNMYVRNKWLRKLHFHVNFEIPIISSLFAVNYIFICSSAENR